MSQLLLRVLWQAVLTFIQAGYELLISTIIFLMSIIQLLISTIVFSLVKYHHSHSKPIVGIKNRFFTSWNCNSTYQKYNHY